MDPIFGGLIAGAANLAGSVFGGLTSASNTQQQMANQQQLQLQSEQYNTQMSNTAYQRATADMKAAGLNPMMMFGSGSAASSPTMSTPAAPVPQTKSPFAGIGDAANAVVNTAVSAKTMDRMTEEIANLKVEQAKRQAETETEKTKPEYVRAETQHQIQQATRLAEEMPASRFRGVSASDMLAINETARRVANQAAFFGGKVNDTIAPFLNTAKSVLPWMRLY